MTDANPLVQDVDAQWPTGTSVWRRRGTQAYDALVCGAARVHLPATMAAIDAAGRLAHRAGLHGPRASDVHALFDWLPEARVDALARDIAALHLKNRAAIALVEGGRIADLARLAQWRSDTDRVAIAKGRTGLLIAAAHVGAFFGIRAALHGIGRPVLMMRDIAQPDAASRAAVLKRAVDCLRAGEIVVATLDGPGGTNTCEVSCLGRRIVLRRGVVTLARLTSTPIVPVVCAWTSRHRIDVQIAPPIDPRGGDAGPPLSEDEMAHRAARWLDAYLRAEPQQMWPSTMRHYLGARRT
jgi:hypothetical protein